MEQGVQYKCILVQAFKTPEYLEWLSKICPRLVRGQQASNPQIPSKTMNESHI